MRQISVLSSAQKDLYQIQIYTFEMWGNSKVIELQDIVDNAYHLLTFSPSVGKKIKIKNTYALVLGKLPFVMIYKIDDEYIYISQFIHTKRNR